MEMNAMENQVALSVTNKNVIRPTATKQSPKIVLKHRELLWIGQDVKDMYMTSRGKIIQPALIVQTGTNLHPVLSTQQPFRTSTPSQLDQKF